VYTLDADIVVIAASLPKLAVYLREQGFKSEEHERSVNALAPASDLRIQFTTDKSAKGADARRQTIGELASSSGGALDTATVLRVFLKSGVPA
jgi:hypothetical protein